MRDVNELLNQAFDSAVGVFCADDDGYRKSVLIPLNPVKIVFLSAAGEIVLKPDTPRNAAAFLGAIGKSSEAWFQPHARFPSPVIITVENRFVPPAMKTEDARNSFKIFLRKTGEHIYRDVAQIIFNGIGDLTNCVQVAPNLNQELPAPPYADVIKTFERAGGNWLNVRFIQSLKLV